MTQRQSSATPYDLVLNLQKNIVSIAQELDEIRFHKQSDLNILNLNVGRLQGLAQSLDWYLMQLSKEAKVAFVPMGFHLSSQQEEQELPLEEEDGDEELRK